MSKGLEVKIEIPNIAKVLPKTRASSAYNSFIQETTSKTIELSASQAGKRELGYELSKIAKKYKPQLKDYFYINIDPNVDFKTIAKADSFGVSTTQRVEKSVNMAIRRARNQSNKLYSDLFNSNTKARVNNTSANELQARANKYIEDYVNGISKSLGHDSSRLIKTEAQSIKEVKKDERNSGKEVIWKLGDNENHCAECIGYSNTIYKTPSNAPSRPVHPNCECTLEPIEDFNKTELNSLIKTQRKTKVRFNLSRR